MDTETERDTRAFLQRLAGRFDVSGACLFGSRACGQYRPDSDADIAVLLHGQREAFFDTKIAMAGVAYDMLLETGVLTQLLPVWEDEWDHPERSANPALLRNINREGVRL